VTSDFIQSFRAAVNSVNSTSRVSASPPSNVCTIPPKRQQHARQLGPTASRSTRRRRSRSLRGRGRPDPRRFLVVDDHVLDILSRVDRQILVASPFQGGHVLSILRVAFQRLGDTISFDEPLHCYVARLKFIARSRHPSTASGDRVALSRSRQSCWTSSMNGGLSAVGLRCL